MRTISVVNMIPRDNGWCDEQNQDSEPGISVNPSNHNELVGTAFTFDTPAGSSAMTPMMHSDWAPVFYSIDGGATWSLHNILPSRAGHSPTLDVTARFSGNGQTIYAALISSASEDLLICRATNPTIQMETLVTWPASDRPDMPFIEATRAQGQDKVYVGFLMRPDIEPSIPRALIHQSLDAASASPSAGFLPLQIDSRNVWCANPTRIAIHPTGVVYAAFYIWIPNPNWTLVVVKDLNWGAGPPGSPPYHALIDSADAGGDGQAGVRVARSIVAGSMGTDSNFGNDRFSRDLAIAVDPNNVERVYIVYSEGITAAEYTLHLRRSIDGGMTWLTVPRTVVKAKNPGLAINSRGDVGFVYQQVVGPPATSRWVTVFEQSSDDFVTVDSNILASVPTSVPTSIPSAHWHYFFTFIGDYVKLQASGRNFVGVFSAANVPDMANFPSGIRYQREVNYATKQLLSLDRTTEVPPSIDPFFFSVVQQELIVTTDRNEFSKDEIEAALHHANPGPSRTRNPAVVADAFRVTVDGFSHTELNITGATLSDPPNVFPDVTFARPLAEVTVRATRCQAEGVALVAGRQRFTWTYDIHFSGTGDFVREVEEVVMTVSMTSTGRTPVSGEALLTLTVRPNPYEIDGATSWLSVDLQVFQLLNNRALPSTPHIRLNAGPNVFIERLLSRRDGGYNDPVWARAPNHPFDLDLVSQQGRSTVSIAGTIGRVPVYNFAVARVRYRALSLSAANVRCFFRLFQCAATSTAYDLTSTYLVGGRRGTKVPLLGVVGNDVVVIPCFAAERVDPTNPDGLNAQTDPVNVGPAGAPIPSDPSGAEVQVYFGCWLDINQPTPVLPAYGNPTTGNHPYRPFQSVQNLLRGAHQCLVAEIDLDPPAPQIRSGATPANSDRLAQRNLSLVGIASPHQVPTTFEIMPSAAPTRRGETPDEIMIDWGQLPDGCRASIYLPGASADEILARAEQLYTRHGLSRSDAHTLTCAARGITYLPVPSSIGSNYAGLLTIQVPDVVAIADAYQVVIRQLRNTSAPRPKMSGTLPKVVDPQDGAAVTVSAPGPKHDLIEWRRVIGAFQVSIPVETKPALLATEERLLSVMRQIAESIAADERWYPVFERYLTQVAERVAALGGDPQQITPSSSGEEWH